MAPLPTTARKVLFYCVLLLMIVLPLEVVSFAYLSLTTGQWASAKYFFRHHFAQQQKEGCWWADTIMPHPFLGFSYHRGEGCSQEGVNDIGLKGPDFPAKNDPNFYDILVLGGSVAELFTARAPKAPNFLEARLNAEFISPNGKPFRLLNGAISAGREPMQLISLALFGDRADAAISLEGYNELGNFRFSRPLADPTLEWKILMASQSGVDWLRYRPFFVAKKLAQFVSGNALLSHSYTLFLTTRLFYSAAEKRAHYSETPSQFDAVTPDFPVVWSEKQRREEIIQQYKRVLRLQRAMAKEENIPYFVFIQPVPALYKRLTPQERSAVGDISYGALYQELSNEILGLGKQGFPIASLLKILVSAEKSIYVDNIHFEGNGAFGAGNKLMADAIADTLAREWRLKRR